MLPPADCVCVRAGCWQLKNAVGLLSHVGLLFYQSHGRPAAAGCLPGLPPHAAWLPWTPLPKPTCPSATFRHAIAALSVLLRAAKSNNLMAVTKYRNSQ